MAEFKVSHQKKSMPTFKLTSVRFGVISAATEFMVSIAASKHNPCRRLKCLQCCGMIHGGTGKKVATREACYWITRMAGFRTQIATTL
jgi:hypothetical protein